MTGTTAEQWARATKLIWSLQVMARGTNRERFAQTLIPRAMARAWASDDFDHMEGCLAHHEWLRAKWRTEL